MQKPSNQLAMLVVINLGLLALGAYISGGSFLSLFNLQSMAGQVPEIGLLAIGVMLAMCAGNGGIDLSGIALANLAGVLSAVIVSMFISSAENQLGFSLAFIGLALLIGLAGGIINGVLIARFNITPILCTLGTQMAFTDLRLLFPADARSWSAAPIFCRASATTCFWLFRSASSSSSRWRCLLLRSCASRPTVTG